MNRLSLGVRIVVFLCVQGVGREIATLWFGIAWSDCLRIAGPGAIRCVKRRLEGTDRADASV